MRKLIILILLVLGTGCGHQKMVIIEVEPTNHTQIEDGEVSINKVIHETSKIINSRDANEVTISENIAENTVKTIEIPAKKVVDIDFVSQAPHANWQNPYKEACEEASVIMAVYGLRGEKLSKYAMNTEIISLVAWQNNAFGYFEDTNADETIQMLQEVYKQKAYKIENPTVNQIKKELADENLIIALVAGQEIGNPYFHPPGPLYHALVIVGYDNDNFITHDPGTKRGENLKYSYETIMNALHDWNGGDVYNGVPVVIVVEK